MSIKVDFMETVKVIALIEASASDDPLSGLTATKQLRLEMERREAILVRRARNQGATWVQIATALGVSKQAIHKKYGGRSMLRREK